MGECKIDEYVHTLVNTLNPSVKCKMLKKIRDELEIFGLRYDYIDKALAERAYGENQRDQSTDSTDS